VIFLRAIFGAKILEAARNQVSPSRRVHALRFGLSLGGGVRLFRGAARLVFVGFVAIGYLSQLVWIMNFFERQESRETFERRFRDFRGELSACLSQKGSFLREGSPYESIVSGALSIQEFIGDRLPP
jgi:hypothetical protein